jgi:hypothetical protein
MVAKLNTLIKEKNGFCYKKRISDPIEIRAKKISQGRQDLQDHLDRGPSAV